MTVEDYCRADVEFTAKLCAWQEFMCVVSGYNYDFADVV